MFFDDDIIQNDERRCCEKYLASFYDESFLYHPSILKKKIVKFASLAVYLYSLESKAFKYTSRKEPELIKAFCTNKGRFFISSARC